MEDYTITSWIEEAEYAIEHYDAVPAYQLIRFFENNQALFDTEYQVRPYLKEEVDGVLRELHFVAFSELSDQDVSTILQSGVLAFLGSETDFGDRLSGRYVSVGYGLREDERIKMREAILKNNEKLGPFSLGEWLRDYETAFPVESRTEETVGQYFLKSTQVSALDKQQVAMLRQLLVVYDQWLAAPLLSIFDLAVLDQSLEQSGGTPISVLSSTERTALVKMQILQAISQYPNLGNQTISEERIKIKSQPAPVRGSLFNWIKYYRDELGIGQHSTVERGQFLFRSENGLKLTAQERENLNLILKSIEENYPLDIDPERQIVIFPPVTTKPQSTQSSPTSSMMRPSVSVAPKPEPAPFVPQPAPLPQPMATQSMAEKFKPAPVSPAYEKIAVTQSPLMEQDRLPGADLGGDVTEAAEHLKREPKPEWIKGVFTKDNIPETLPVAPVAGAMSFSFNHTLPAEKEEQPASPSISKPAPQAPTRQQPVAPSTKKPSGQFHIRPMSRPDL